MMVTEKEKTSISTFVCDQLRDEADLSTLTLGILKKRYLTHVRCESLTSEAKYFMKQVVEEELMKMQDNEGNGKEFETRKPQNKRKREKENDEVIRQMEEEAESRAKKSRCHSSSSSESEDKEDCKNGSEESEEEEHVKSGSEDEEQDVKKSQKKTNGDHKHQIKSEDSTDEEINESGKKGNESKDADSPREMNKNKANGTNNGESKSSSASQGKKTQSDEEEETDSDSKSENGDKIDRNYSSDDSKIEEKASMEKKDDPDSDSSSLPSLGDEQDRGTENGKDNKKKKNMKKRSARSHKDDDKAVARLKRYIALCGIRQNYKKLLGGCNSVRSQVAVLKKELEELGVQGQPSIKKCKKIRMKREQAQELAGLDTSNIIATKGRPKRRGASAWQNQHSPPSSAHVHALNSSSDSDQENGKRRGRKRATDWANLKGIISDDADSN